MSEHSSIPPTVSGVLHGIAIAGLSCAISSTGVGDGLEWPLLTLAGLGFGRSAGYQAGLVLPICLVASVMSGVAAMAFVLPVAAAMVVANLVVPTELAERYSIQHGAYAGVALLAYTLALTFYTSLWSCLRRMFWSILIILLAAAIAFVGKIGREILAGFFPEDSDGRRLAS